MTFNKIVNKDLGCVDVLLEPSKMDVESFISIYIDDKDLNMNSPFRNIDDAEAFADVIIGLLKLVGDDDDIE